MCSRLGGSGEINNPALYVNNLEANQFIEKAIGNKILIDLRYSLQENNKVKS
jgi:hypothetical protein